MAQVKFKNDGDKIVMIGREPLTSDNLTFEKYKALVDQYPQLAEKFEVIDEVPSAKKIKDNNKTE